MSTEESNSSTKLALFLTPPSMKLKFPAHDHHPSGVLTPPLHTCLASVPFKWELRPGKPRPYCTDIIIFNDQPKSLEPPPRLYFLDKITKIPSSPERGQLGTLVLYKDDNTKKVCRRGPYWWQRLLKRRPNRNGSGVGGGSLVISSSSSDSGNGLERNGNFSRSHSHILVSLFSFFFLILKKNFFFLFLTPVRFHD